MAAEHCPRCEEMIRHVAGVAVCGCNRKHDGPNSLARALIRNQERRAANPNDKRIYLPKTGSLADVIGAEMAAVDREVEARLRKAEASEAKAVAAELGLEWFLNSDGPERTRNAGR